MKPTVMTMPTGRVPRLYHDAVLDRSEIALDSKQAHYLRQVLRLKRGQSVVLFDGQGQECLASVTRLTRDGGELHVETRVAAIPASGLHLTLLQAIAKAEAMDLIVQKATELGVTTIAPVLTEFCVVRLDEERAQSRVEHWRRIARSACEQSGRHEPTSIETPEPLERHLDKLVSPSKRLVLDPRAATGLRDALADYGGEPVYVLVGPEGGLGERDSHWAARAGFTPVSLGVRILRTETAAIAACSLVQALCGDMG